MFGAAYNPVMMGFEQSIPLPMTEVVGGITYIGYSKRLGVGPNDKAWLIIRITVAGSLTTPEYAEGTNKFDKAWADRASLNYSR